MIKDYFERDRKNFFPRSFNEQMTWIGEEVENIIKNNEKFHSKEKILKEEKEQKELMEEYGAQDRGVQYAIKHEKIKIYLFDESSEKWTWGIAPEQIFGKENEK